MLIMIDPQAQHPMIAEWVKVLIGTVVGFVSAVATDSLRTYIQDKRKKRDMRIALYHELGRLYTNVQPLAHKPFKTAEEQDAIAHCIGQEQTTTYDWAKSQPDVFYKLKEAHLIDNVYSSFQFIKEAHRQPGASLAILEVGKKFASMMESYMAAENLFDNELFKKEVPLRYNAIIARGNTSRPANQQLK
jgi:hypothetical protein